MAYLPRISVDQRAVRPARAAAYTVRRRDNPQLLAACGVWF